jgi:hypothetical protein
MATAVGPSYRRVWFAGLALWRSSLWKEGLLRTPYPGHITSSLAINLSDGFLNCAKICTRYTTQPRVTNESRSISNWPNYEGKNVFWSPCVWVIIISIVMIYRMMSRESVVFCSCSNIRCFITTLSIPASCLRLAKSAFLWRASKMQSRWVKIWSLRSGLG